MDYLEFNEACGGSEKNNVSPGPQMVRSTYLDQSYLDELRFREECSKTG